MKRKLLFIVTADPRISPAPAEAVRIAAGLAAWERVTVALYLRGPAIQLLAEDVSDLVDGDYAARYLPALLTGCGLLFVQAEAPELGMLGDSPWLWQPIADAALADLVAGYDYVLNYADEKSTPAIPPATVSEPVKILSDNTPPDCRLLHILLHPADPMATEFMKGQQSKPGQTVVIFDASRDAVDYDALLREVFAADAIAVW